MSVRPQLHITVVRHGETNSNLNHILQGHLDTKLNKVGREQADLVGKRLRKMKFDHIYSSDLSRAKKTAEAIAKHHPNTPFSVDMRLREKDIGRLSGLSIYEALDLIKNEGSQWEDYGESDEDFTDNILSFFDEIIDKHLPDTQGPESIEHPKKNTHILLVTHGGTINKLVREHMIHDLGFLVNDYLSIRHKAKNTSVTKIVVRRKITDDVGSRSVSRRGSGVSSSDGATTPSSEASTIEIVRGVQRKPRLEGDINMWSCVAHLAKLGKRTRGDSSIDDYVH
ncbi:10179_t:CDS:2 [Ambispora leptoticha]|uniref:10179_t:CDS:1 n=1 Tax=Ambispora leptoticha TaxID=144679 RepID=A0A9N9CPH7_9GLOM|nr:10179_t:CDS:2 [Ambispora leptoticha]